MTMAGMNWTAWNSVVANALLSRPRAIPSTAPRIAVGDDDPRSCRGCTGPAAVRRSRRSRRPAAGRCHGEGDAVAEQQVELGRIGVVSRRCEGSRSAPARAARLTLVTRNIVVKGKIPSRLSATRSNCGLRVEHLVRQHQEQAGTTNIAVQLQQDPVRGGGDDPPGHDPPTHDPVGRGLLSGRWWCGCGRFRRRASGQKVRHVARLLDCSSPALRPIRRRNASRGRPYRWRSGWRPARRRRPELPVAHQQQPVAAAGLVHDVAGDGRRRAHGGGEGDGSAAHRSLACRQGVQSAPERLVLDEPTVGLDPLLRRDLWAMFHRAGGAMLGRRRPSPATSWMRLSRCDRLLLMRDGEF